MEENKTFKNIYILYSYVVQCSL